MTWWKLDWCRVGVAEEYLVHAIEFNTNALHMGGYN